MPISDPQKHEFHMEEHRQLRGEIAAQLARIEALLRYTMVVSALVYAWLLVQSVGFEGDNSVAAHNCLRLPAHLLMYGWAIPPVFITVAGLGAYVLRKRVDDISRYMIFLEHAMGERALGFEIYLDNVGSSVTKMGRAIWVALLTVTLVFSIHGGLITFHAKDVPCMGQGHKS